MASGFIEHTITQDNLENKALVTMSFVSSRAENVSGGMRALGAYAFISVKFKAKATASNSPQVGNVLSGYFPRTEVAASCIDITSGISSSITSGVPAGISTEGKIYVKEITTDHIYALTCAYIANI